MLALLATGAAACGGTATPQPEPTLASASPTPSLLPATPAAATPAPVITATAQPEATAAGTPSGQSVFLPQVVGGNEAVPTAASPVTATAALTGAPASPEATALPRLNLADLPAIALADWPRPANDNGLCIHNMAVAYFDEAEIDRQIERLKAMNMRWTVVHYGDELQLQKAAPRFRDAGIMVVWRKALRAYDRYYGWGRDIELLRSLGVEPYMQLYNEPSLDAEWDGKPVDQRLFLDNLMSAVEQVYNAGGYVGLQFVSDDWLTAALEEIQARGGQQVFQRMFLAPHPYGLNHPPDYTADPNGVLGFLHQAQVVSDTIGFTPPMIAAEGGWKWNATDDRNFPAIDATLHRDYHLAVFDWFRSGVLSNGQPLPDTLFAFCPWLLSDQGDDSAWFDSFGGERTATIDAVKAIPPFVRRFSWEGS